MLVFVLTLLVLVSASMHIPAECRGARQRVYLFKPLTMVVILLVALSVSKAQLPRNGRASSVRRDHR